MTEAVGSSEWVYHSYQNARRDISKRHLQERACYFFRFYKKQDRQCTYKRNIEARSRNHCCREKAISSPIIYARCVSVALLIQHALRVRNIIGPVAVCGLSGSNRFFCITS